MRESKWIRNAFGDVIGMEIKETMTLEEAKTRYPEMDLSKFEAEKTNPTLKTK